MIKEIENHIYSFRPDGTPELVGSPLNEEIADKLNEVIRCLNKLENEKHSH
jgi:hypothetical protein